jgi:hypothetical protein
MDALPIDPQEGAMYHLLERCMQEGQEIPKEAQYLCEYLSAHGSADFRANRVQS